MEIIQARRDGLSGEILEGILRSPAGRQYFIRSGIPDFAPEFQNQSEAQTVRAFGREWARYENSDGYVGSTELFFQFTGLTPEQVRGRTVLEVGCGAGRWLKVMAQLGAREVVGLDFSTAVFQAARQTASLPDVHVVRGSVLHMPFLPKFDLVVCIGVIHHLSDPVMGLKGIAEVVLPSHLIVVSVYAREGNELYLKLIRPLRFLGPKMPESILVGTSRVLTAILWAHIHSLNRISVRLGWRTPLRDYLELQKHLRFRDLESIVYDQLAPSLARYPMRQDLERWVYSAGGRVDYINHRTGNYWRCHVRFDQG